MSSPYALEPEFTSQPVFTLPANRFALRGIDWLLRRQRRGFRWSDAVEVHIHSLASASGAVVPLLEIAPRDLSGRAPAILDYHGGGFFLGYAPLHLRAAERYALEGRCRVYFPDYRLSTAEPFPAAFDDCYAALAWVHGRDDVDRERVALLGDSAGGALAAGVAQQALDRGEHPLCAQVLIYPVCDHQTATPSALRFHDTPLWRTASNRNMWKVYLRGSEWARSDGSAPPPPYAVPLQRADFSGLPPARIELAEFDPLLDEGRLYAEALAGAGVSTEVVEVSGAIHGYDLVPKSPTAERVFGERMQAIRRLLGTAP